MQLVLASIFSQFLSHWSYIEILPLRRSSSAYAEENNSFLSSCSFRCCELHYTMVIAYLYSDTNINAPRVATRRRNTLAFLGDKFGESSQSVFKIELMNKIVKASIFVGKIDRRCQPITAGLKWGSGASSLLRPFPGWQVKPVPLSGRRSTVNDRSHQARRRQYRCETINSRRRQKFAYWQFNGFYTKVHSIWKRLVTRSRQLQIEGCMISSYTNSFLIKWMNACKFNAAEWKLRQNNWCINFILQLW